MLSEQNAKQLWNFVNRGEEFPWPRSQKSKEKLSASLARLIQDDSVRSQLDTLDKDRFNLRIRELIAPALTAGGAVQSVVISNWLVRDWGGIKTGNQAIAGWIEKLGDFNNENVSVFVRGMGTKRISSWSKILAFANPQMYAVYDARTAVALNCGLHSLGIDWRFVMPLSQNKRMTTARKLLEESRQGTLEGYQTYIDVLRLMSNACGLNGNILEVEMMLFANAPVIADNHIASYASA